MAWPFKRSEKRAIVPQIYFTNSLTGNKELFVPLKAGSVSMYSCGPTVYGPIHIGNLRSYVFADTIARVLMQAGYHVRRVMNITDVGHLVDDADEGEDKMAVGAKREKVSPAEIAARYARGFLADIADLNIDIQELIFPRATEYIKEQIAMAKSLEEKGFAYKIPEGLYFDTSKFPTYGALGNIGHAHLKSGARVKVVEDKRHPSDFALWRTAKPGDLQQWPSPWGSGNPGWSIECSAMARSLLGIELDIHTGGEDNAPIHHNNEIAQSEAANGRKFVRYWMHGAFLNINGQKISKSLGNVVYLADIVDRGFHPLALRYFFFQAQYRTPLSFSWDAIASANEALHRLWRLASEIDDEAEGKAAPSGARERFALSMRDDLSTPQALGVLWESLKSEEYSPEEKWGLLQDADKMLGLSLVEPPAEALALAQDALPEEIKTLLERRELARKTKDFTLADSFRSQIERSGYTVDDGPSGPVLTKRTR
jgi:cysteinyl-tRNA synthetase